MPTTPHTPDRPALHAAKDEPPETAVRRLLIAIVGLSPQVVTETLWALRTERGFVPDVVRVILTRSTRDCVVKSLLDPVEGRFHAFCRDYGLVGKIHFDESCVTVVADGEGRELDDIRTPEESAAAADTIVRVIGNACSDPNVIVHVSIAGGRKSMGFFAGYAMSLFCETRGIRCRTCSSTTSSNRTATSSIRRPNPKTSSRPRRTGFFVAGARDARRHSDRAASHGVA